MKKKKVLANQSSDDRWRTSQQRGQIGRRRAPAQIEAVQLRAVAVQRQVMGNVGQRLQDVVGHGEQEVGGEQPAEAKDAVAHRQGNSEESEKVETEEFQQTAEEASQFFFKSHGNSFLSPSSGRGITVQQLQRSCSAILTCKTFKMSLSTRQNRHKFTKIK